MLYSDFWAYDGQSGVIDIYTIPLGCVFDDVSLDDLKYRCDGWKENPLRGLLCRIYGRTEREK
jgi:hypothetical protein